MFTLILIDDLRKESTGAAIPDEALRPFGLQHEEPQTLGQYGIGFEEQYLWD